MSCENKRVVAIFAHNEAENIIACLNSVKREIRSGDECYVLNNGSCDNTEELVSDFSKENEWCNLVSIEIGDKANAWNVFCHQLRVQAALFIFLDGDCVVVKNSFDALELCMSNNPSVNAVAGLPAEYCSQKNREEMLVSGGLAGNLYALSQEFVARIRKEGIFLPIGLIGDDSLVGSLAYWNLNPRNDWDKSKIVNCEDANFAYRRLSLLSFSDVKMYWKRKIRYSLRRYQNIIIGFRLKVGGVSAMPKNIEEIYHDYPSVLRLKWRGVDTWFDFLALRRVAREIESRRGYFVGGG